MINGRYKGLSGKKLFVFFFLKKAYYFCIIFSVTGMFLSNPETCRETLPSPYLKHPALEEMKFNTLNN